MSGAESTTLSHLVIKYRDEVVPELKSKRHTENGDYKNGIHRGEDLYENDGFIVHFFSKEKVKQLSNGFDIVNIENFEEGKFPRKLFHVTLKKV